MLNKKTISAAEESTQSAAGHAEMKVELSWKLFPHWLALIVLEGTLQIPGKDLSSATLSQL